MYNRYRLRNRILQMMYRPRRGKSRFFSKDVVDALYEIDRRIEEDITPLLSELF